MLLEVSLHVFEPCQRLGRRCCGVADQPEDHQWGRRWPWRGTSGPRPGANMLEPITCGNRDGLGEGNGCWLGARRWQSLAPLSCHTAETTTEISTETTTTEKSSERTTRKTEISSDKCKPQELLAARRAGASAVSLCGLRSPRPPASFYSARQGCVQGHPPYSARQGCVQSHAAGPVFKTPPYSARQVCEPSPNWPSAQHWKPARLAEPGLIKSASEART